MLQKRDKPYTVLGDKRETVKGFLERFAPERRIRADPDRDETDTEAGLRDLRERGCGEAVMADGGRKDWPPARDCPALREEKPPDAAGYGRGGCPSGRGRG
jgi:hypothetical protein